LVHWQELLSSVSLPIRNYAELSATSAVLVLTFAVLLPAGSINHAYAMGDNPSSCMNRYDATITSLTVNNGIQKFDPLAHSGLTFYADIDTGYLVTFILHAASQSSLDNTDSGTTWYTDSAFGFSDGRCVANAGPSKDIQITVQVTATNGIPDGYTQSGVYWGALPDTSQVTYNVVWQKELREPTNLTLNSISSVPWGQQVKVSGKLVDSVNGIGVGGKTIAFSGTGASNLASIVTNSDGTFTTSGISPTTVATGWTVQARFAGDSQYISKDGTMRSYNTLKHNTSLTLYIYPNPVAPSGTYKVYGALKDDITSMTLSARTITFTTTTPTSITDTTTDNYGKYKVSGLIAPSITGDYQIQSHYAGDSKYLARDSKVKTLTVETS
jgi:hypothetical protein